MESEKKPIIWMILFGVIRALLAWFGGKLQGWGVIDAETHNRLLTEGTAQVVSYLLLAAPIIWSVLQKLQVWGWVKTALHLTSRTSAAEVPAIAAGPNIPV